MSSYTGIGSRETPAQVCEVATRLARVLRGAGYTLRSGHADGADKAFEAGAGDAAEIFLPWRGFNGSRSPFFYEGPKESDAARIAAKFHPAWHRCSAGAKKLHTRNVYQVLGADLDQPSEFVVCWTKDGQASGGTGQALRIAAHYGIPIFNLHDPFAESKLEEHLLLRGDPLAG